MTYPPPCPLGGQGGPCGLLVSVYRRTVPLLRNSVYGLVSPRTACQDLRLRSLYTPNNTGKYSSLTYNRVCWHANLTALFIHYMSSSSCIICGLPALRQLPTCGVAVSLFRALHKIHYCCSPKGSYPCFSVSVADRTFIPATDLCLGGPLPHLLANPKSAPPTAL